MLASLQTRLERILAYSHPDRNRNRRRRASLAKRKTELQKETHLIQALLDMVLAEDMTPRGISAIRAIKNLGENEIVCDYLLSKLAASSGDVRAKAADAFWYFPQRAAMRQIRSHALRDTDLITGAIRISTEKYSELVNSAKQCQDKPNTKACFDEKGRKVPCPGFHANLIKNRS